ncbi:MAG: hypothetical protein WC277_06820 [Bacilli bacterium]|jgi:hypothetical protein
MRYLPPGTLVRVTAPSPFAGKIAKVVRHFPATENCMVSLPDARGVTWVADSCLEVIS